MARSRDVMALALDARICANSARKALKHGPYTLRGDAGVRAAESMRRLGLRPDVPVLATTSGPAPQPTKESAAE